MTRLNNTIRDNIVNAAVIDAFGESLEEHKAKETPLADRLYEMTYGEISERVKKADLPEDWTLSTALLRINCDGSFKFTLSSAISDAELQAKVDALMEDITAQ